MTTVSVSLYIWLHMQALEVRTTNRKLSVWTLPWYTNSVLSHKYLDTLPHQHRACTFCPCFIINRAKAEGEFYLPGTSVPKFEQPYPPGPQKAQVKFSQTIKMWTNLLTCITSSIQYTLGLSPMSPVFLILILYSQVLFVLTRRSTNFSPPTRSIQLVGLMKFPVWCSVEQLMPSPQP